MSGGNRTALLSLLRYTVLRLSRVSVLALFCVLLCLCLCIDPLRSRVCARAARTRTESDRSPVRELSGGGCSLFCVRALWSNTQVCSNEIHRLQAYRMACAASSHTDSLFVQYTSISSAPAGHAGWCAHARGHSREEYSHSVRASQPLGAWHREYTSSGEGRGGLARTRRDTTSTPPGGRAHPLSPQRPQRFWDPRRGRSWGRCDRGRRGSRQTRRPPCPTSPCRLRLPSLSSPPPFESFSRPSCAAGNAGRAPGSWKGAAGGVNRSNTSASRSPCSPFPPHGCRGRVDRATHHRRGKGLRDGWRLYSAGRVRLRHFDHELGAF